MKIKETLRHITYYKWSKFKIRALLYLYMIKILKGKKSISVVIVILPITL
jgi:hypothetical protein